MRSWDGGILVSMQYENICVYIYIYTHICTHIYIYIFSTAVLHIYIYTYVHMYVLFTLGLSGLGSARCASASVRGFAISKAMEPSSVQGCGRKLCQPDSPCPEVVFDPELWPLELWPLEAPVTARRNPTSKTKIQGVPFRRT